MELLNVLQQNNLVNFDDVKFFLNNNNLKVKDSDNLYIINYDKQKSDFSKQFVKECRGIILEKNTNKIICYTFNNNNDFDYEEEYKFDFNNMTIEESIDGTQIRLYNYENEWRVATTRCIDAYKTSWLSDKTFGQLFDDVKHLVNMEELNKNNCYSFVLQHIDNRIVLNYNKNNLVLVCVRDMDTLEEIDKFEEGKRLELSLPKICKHFKSMNELVYYCKNDKNMNEGFMLYDNETKNRIKIIKKHYTYIKDMLRNTPNLEYRFYMLLKNKNIGNYLKYYPEHNIKFEIMKKRTNNIVQNIHYNYMRKNINKDIVMTDIPFGYRPLVYKLHGLYIKNKTKITYEVVMEEFLKLHEKQHCFIYNSIYNI